MHRARIERLRPNSSIWRQPCVPIDAIDVFGVASGPGRSPARIGIATMQGLALTTAGGSSRSGARGAGADGAAAAAGTRDRRLDGCAPRRVLRRCIA